jgi:hypothetical protein
MHILGAQPAEAVYLDDYDADLADLGSDEGMGDLRQALAVGASTL